MSKIKLIPHKTYGKQKTYTDLKIALIRERGILNVWRDYCDKNGLMYKNDFYKRRSAMEINEYGYKEYLNEVKNNPTQENINRLGAWFERYGTDLHWNGERFNAGEFGLYPVIEWNNETDSGTIVGYEMKY